MAHTTAVVRQEQPNDDCVTVTIRCCDDSKTDSTTTIYSLHAQTPEEIKAKIDAHHDAVASKHAGMLVGTATLATLSKRSKIHP
jgi:hypothetical protein